MAAPRRITIPVELDHRPAATAPVAAVLAEQGAFAVERVPGPGPQVAAYATWSGSTLLCVGTRAHRGVGRAAAALMATSGIPVLVVGPHTRAGGGRFEHVVVAVDDSRHGAATASVAAGLADACGADLTLIEVFAPGTTPGEVPEAAHLLQLAGELDQPLFDTLHDRRPARGILRFVGDDPCCIVVLGLQQRAGSVVTAVIRHACGPVLVAPLAPSTASAASTASTASTMRTVPTAPAPLAAPARRRAGSYR